VEGAGRGVLGVMAEGRGCADLVHVMALRETLPNTFAFAAQIVRMDLVQVVAREEEGERGAKEGGGAGLVNDLAAPVGFAALLPEGGAATADVPAAKKAKPLCRVHFRAPVNATAFKRAYPEAYKRSTGLARLDVRVVHPDGVRVAARLRVTPALVEMWWCGTNNALVWSEEREGELCALRRIDGSLEVIDATVAGLDGAIDVHCEATASLPLYLAVELPSLHYRVTTKSRKGAGGDLEEIEFDTKILAIDRKRADKVLARLFPLDDIFHMMLNDLKYRLIYRRSPAAGEQSWAMHYDIAARFPPMPKWVRDECRDALENDELEDDFLLQHDFMEAMQADLERMRVDLVS